ncbi:MULTISPECIES: BTAD domain-containing putative transcriptional regulator [Streptomyces]|uniref:BTAD domain-containing putative transcriptional regulator n=1 Tax=Streptomyces TaxID=1883 RepID=UPI000DC64EE4|nr:MULTISPECIES: BTAD domain-containing putative transcriptional regulator [Streptomyces]ATY98262.1 AfsR family transcriptional regulator [Streptomyces cavourensis]NUV83111.1 AfsR/SARP family transcriptional regulator [Streptomyces sp. CAI-155]WAE68710.1 BTAD domain-containing putative transcriptional regulator [Streptomyces cavourensis]
MRFGVLGPLAVWTADGRPVRVPELKVRALLALLLSEEGRPVSADRIVDELWGAKLPANPTGVLQTKVWQLRRALEDAEPGGRELVVSLAPGYRLGAEGDAVDAGRFHRLTARARSADDPRERAGLLADALALWRGPAFADFADEEFARATRDRLEEQRLTVLEEQAEVRLELGEHALVADELGDLVALHPLRERLRTAHIRALYLAGRQGAALSSYADLRERLAEDLGVDPGPELAALHRSILVQDPGLAAAPSPATSVVRPPTNLPAALTELIGRSGAIEELRTLLGTGRLVTLTGAGGVGKTQLALATASRLLDRFPGGVRLAEFAALDPSRGPAGAGRERSAASPAGVHEVVGAVLGVRDDSSPNPAGGAPLAPVDRLAHALGDEPALLVFDNCEHVIDEVAELAEQLLKAAPQLRILATSQKPLGITGEHLQEVEPLRRPEPGTGLDPDTVRQFSAVRLFEARARAAAPHFVLDRSNVEAVVSVCRRLDGIPLALEMAATRVRALGVTELAARLDDRFPLLAVGSRSAPERQRTLRSVIDWSWGLLGEQERTVLRRLAVHSDGATLDAAEAVCAAEGPGGPPVLDLLARLVDCSLVVMADGTDGPRYRLLESVAAYCAERLRESGESERVRRAHRAYYTELAERGDPHLRGHGQRQWLRRLDAESANLRAALDSCAQGGDADRALRLVNALAWYWRLRGRNQEAERSLSLALSLAADAGPPAAPGEAVARASAVARTTAWLAGVRLAIYGSGDPRATYEAALRPYAEVDDPAGRARAQWFLASHLYGIGDVAPSEELVGRALEGFRSLGDDWGTAAALGSRTYHAKLRGDFAAVRRDGEQSLALFRELGDQWGQLQAMVPLQTLAEAVGDYAYAGRLYRDGLRMAEALGLWREVAFQLSGLGRLALLTGDLPGARDLHERARRLAAEQSDMFGEQYAEVGLGLGARRTGELAAAEAHMRRVLDLHRRMGYAPGAPPLILAELGFVAELRGDAAEALRLQREGLAVARATGDPRAVALGLEGLAGAELLAGRAERAARLLGAAAAARESVGVPLPEGERYDIDRISAGTVSILGRAAFEAAFAAGGGPAEDALSPDDTGPGPV